MSASKKSLTPALERKEDTGQIIMRLLTYMTGGDSRQRFMVAMAWRVVGLLGLIAIPFFTGQAINAFSEPGGTIAQVRLWAILAAIAGLLSLAFSITAERIFSSLATTALYRLQRELFERMQTLSLNFFDRQPVGELMSRVTNDTETVALFYESAVAQIMRAIIQIGLIIIVMFVINWQLTLVALLIVPVMLFLTSVIEGGHIEFKDVDFSYVPGRKILRHNTFEAKPGETIGICGPTGAGKSTIINILTRYYDIDSGTILIDGQDLKLLTQDSLRRQIGAVLQEAFLFSDTVMNNLMFAREGATEEECIAAAKQANAHDFIEYLPQGYNTMMTERGANLSQGQRQMITIARAMVAQPKVLILDEATSNVDTRTEKLIQEGLQRLMANRTSFVIAHRLSTIRHAHKILVVNGGEIEEIGPHDELMARKGFYYALYMSQFKGKGPAEGESEGNIAFVSS